MSIAPPVPPSTLNCFHHAMVEVLEWSGRTDWPHVLAQPLGLGFECELGTRDWWLLGHGELTYQTPRFNLGLRASWSECRPAFFSEIVADSLARQHPIVFQTEWTHVPHSSHFGYGLGDIHVSVVFDISADGRRIQVLDRMAVRGQPETLLRWFELDDYERAFRSRLEVLEYEWCESDVSWPDSLRELLATSSANLRDSSGTYAPHRHIVTGVDGVEYLSDAIAYMRPEFRGDRQVQLLLIVRLPDCVRSHIVAPRRWLRELCITGDSRGCFERVGEVLATSCHLWRHWADAVAAVGRDGAEALATFGTATRTLVAGERALTEIIDYALSETRRP